MSMDYLNRSFIQKMFAKSVEIQLTAHESIKTLTTILKLLKLVGPLQTTMFHSNFGEV